jgi:hypothetical protein
MEPGILVVPGSPPDPVVVALIIKADRFSVWVVLAAILLVIGANAGFAGMEMVTLAGKSWVVKRRYTGVP